jgi:hypothetical protein
VRLLDGSGVSRETHAPFCERLGVRFPRSTHLNFGEDACKVRKDNAPQNLSLLRKMVLSLLRTDKTESVPPKKKKVSLRCKRKQAAWDDDIRMKILGIQPL